MNKAKLNNKGISRTALLDGDVIAYRVALRYNPEAEFLSLEQAVMAEVNDWSSRAFCDDFIVCLSDDNHNYRKDVYKKYKANRADKEKPELLGDVRKILKESDHSVTMRNLEADDVMGIYATRLPEAMVVVTIDKDLKTLPIWLFNPDKDDFPRHISDEEAAFNLWSQVITGDSVDGYPGAWRRGEVSAHKALSGKAVSKMPEEAWRVYYRIGEDMRTPAGLKFFAAMVNCARILSVDTITDAGDPILFNTDDMKGFTCNDELT